MNSHWNWKYAEEIAGIVNEITNPEEEITVEKLAEAERTIISLAKDIAETKQ